MQLRPVPVLSPGPQESSVAFPPKNLKRSDCNRVLACTAGARLWKSPAWFKGDILVRLTCYRNLFLYPCGVWNIWIVSSQVCFFSWVNSPNFLNTSHRGNLRQCSGKESTCQCMRWEFDAWVGKIIWRRKWLPTLGFLPGKSYGQRSLVGYSP